MHLFEIELATGILNAQTFSMMAADWRENAKQYAPAVVGQIDRFKIFMIEMLLFGSPAMYVAAFDTKEKRYAAYLQMEHLWEAKAQNCYVARLVSVGKAYRGLNLATKMYSFLIKNENLIIVSDETQSEGGRSLWVKLAKEPGIQVYGFNTETRKVFQVDMDDLFNEDVYDDEIEKEIVDLTREQNSIEDSKNPDDIKRLKKIEKELESLEKSSSAARNNIRLFATEVR